MSPDPQDAEVVAMQAGLLAALAPPRVFRVRLNVRYREGHLIRFFVDEHGGARLIGCPPLVSRHVLGGFGMSAARLILSARVRSPRGFGASRAGVPESHRRRSAIAAVSGPLPRPKPQSLPGQHLGRLPSGVGGLFRVRSRACQGGEPAEVHPAALNQSGQIALPGALGLVFGAL